MVIFHSYVKLPEGIHLPYTTCHEDIGLPGDYYFHNVMINIFLVNVIALFAFSVPIPDVGDRLGLLSGTLVAVTAYQSVINSVIP
jgi:hypothetical protein